MIANRVVMIGLAAVCLAIAYARFTITEKESRMPFSMLDLSTRVPGLDSETGQFEAGKIDWLPKADFQQSAGSTVVLPVVTRITPVGGRTCANFSAF